MLRHPVLKLLVLGVVIVLLGSGCGSFRKKRKAGTDVVPMNPWDQPLDERFEEGERITNVHFSNVLFSYDSYTVSDREAPKVEAVAEYMQTNPDVRLVVEGHCDERGSREYNMSLGEHRALAVRAYLIGLRVDGSRIQTRSYGEEQPFDSGHNDSAWRLNRRAEFVLYR